MCSPPQSSIEIRREELRGDEGWKGRGRGAAYKQLLEIARSCPADERRYDWGESTAEPDECFDLSDDKFDVEFRKILKVKNHVSACYQVCCAMHIDRALSKLSPNTCVNKMQADVERCEKEIGILDGKIEKEEEKVARIRIKNRIEKKENTEKVRARSL